MVLKQFKRVETKPVRDMMIIGVPEAWSQIEDDDVIKARLEREATELMLTQRVAFEMSGQGRVIPPILGILRDFKIDLVRKIEDTHGIVVEHGDCTECTDAVALLAHAAEAGDLPNGIVGVIQFTFDEITGAE